MKRLVGRLLMTSALSAAVCTAHASAQNSAELDEVMVTATKTGATKVQQTPLAVTAFSGDQLEQSMLGNVKDLSNFAPDLNISQTTTFAEIYIRGVGSNNTGNGSDPDVTVQVDGIYLARPFSQFADFLDVERVEVLRGPQGTIYGRNAVGGTINIVSKKPTDDFHAEEQVTVGNYAAVQNQAYVSGPIVPGKLQASISTNYARHDAYQENVGPGNDVNDQNQGGFRAQLRYEPDDAIEATTRIDFSLADYHLANFDVLLAPLSPALVAQGATNGTIYKQYQKVDLNTPQMALVRTMGASEEIDDVIDSHLTLKSLSAYRKAVDEGHVDSDYTNLNTAYVFQSENEEEITQEFNLVGHYEDVEFVTGLYYLHESDQSATYIARPPANLRIGVPPLTHTDSEAAYGQGTYHITSDVSATFGIRYTAEQKDMHQNYNFTNLITGVPTGAPSATFDLDRQYFAVTPKYGLDWQITPDAMAYFTATKGYKSGGFNYVSSSAATAAFAPEKLQAFELGGKTDWLDHRLRLNLTGFLYDYDNLQVNQLISPGNVAISNAATASIKGIELEITAKPTPQLKLTANLARLDAKYSNYPNAPLAAALGTGTVNATGHYLDAAPPYSANLSAQYDWDIAGDDVYLRAEYSWQDKVYYDPSNFDSQGQDAYGLLNIYAGLIRQDGWQLQVFGRNVTDKQYIYAAAANGLEPSGLAGAPRTYGIRLTKSW